MPLANTTFWAHLMKDHHAKLDELQHISGQLFAREPIFHRPELGTSQADFEAMMAPEFWEVGASGKAYTREYVLEVLKQRQRTAITEEQLEISEFCCQRVSQDHYLVTYLLDQSGRKSRRVTLWRNTDDGWKIVYHQGTLVSGEILIPPADSP
jgi:hypothetical protein